MAEAQVRQPLKVEGKQTIFQRVLAKSDSQLHQAPSGTVTGPITPFQPFYVYGREGADWIEVGRSLLTGPEGWMKAADTVVWKQNIIVSFNNPAVRQRQLMFDTMETLHGVVEHQSGVGMARRLRVKAVQEGPGAAEGVVTIEPENAVPIEENFYLLPILDWKAHEHQSTFNEVRFLKLASLPLEEEEEQEVEEEPEASGLVFVIDTTSSMEPYIEGTQAAVRDIISEIRDSEAREFVRFGAIGFRDSLEAGLAATPPRDVGYLTREFLALSPDQNPDEVIAKLEQIDATDASTVGFSEDAVAGIYKAIHMQGWDNAGLDGGEIVQRYVVVISDASPKSPSDPYAAYDLVPEHVRLLAEKNRIKLIAIHVKTPDGVANHRVAASAYREMTLLSSGQSNYYPVDLIRGGDEQAAYRPVIDKIVEFVKGEYERTAEEMRRAQEDGELDALQEASLAMRLDWLGRQANAQAPDVIEAWTMDYSLEDPNLEALDVRLLVTKNELATMRDVLQRIVDAGEDSRNGEEGDFFGLLRTAFAAMSQDSSRLVNTEFETLEDAVGEFLEDLPYRPEILRITPDDWASMGSQRTVILDRVRSSLTTFEYIHDSPQYWTSLYEGQPDGETVYAMPLSELP